MPLFSVIIPAYNEEKYLPDTIAAIRKSEIFLGEAVEIIVGDNLSTDKTAQVAAELGAKVVTVEKRVISAVRNQATAAATGKYLVFVDADDLMAENTLQAIKEEMDSGRYVGGGTANVRYDRESWGIRFTHGMVKLALKFTGISMFLFYTTPEAFHAIGGFDENLLSTEDDNFARRLKKYGKSKGLKYCHLPKSELVKSSRKFSEYGDWAIFKHPITFIKACFNDPNAAYELWYKPKR